MSLERFKKPIEVAHEVIDEKYIAYKMDMTDNEKDARKTVDMRKAAVLGTCQCCDCFLSTDESVILIEETQLSKTVEEIRKASFRLDDKDEIDKTINREIIKELQLKTYGAMLVLCRLAATCTSVRELVEGKKYQFWLVASKVDTTDEKRYFEYQKSKLKKGLRDVIGRISLKDVKVWSVDDLKAWFAKNAPTP